MAAEIPGHGEMEISEIRSGPLGPNGGSLGEAPAGGVPPIDEKRPQLRVDEDVPQVDEVCFWRSDESIYRDGIVAAEVFSAVDQLVQQGNALGGEGRFVGSYTDGDQQHQVSVHETRPTIRFERYIDVSGPHGSWAALMKERDGGAIAVVGHTSIVDTFAALPNVMPDHAEMGKIKAKNQQRQQGQ